MGVESQSLEYRDKFILAPMVRIGTLPSRLLALKYGADLVYSEEIIDFKILKTERVENKILGTVDFLLPDGTVVFRTCTAEKDKVVFQMGTADPQRALQAAKLVENDVAAIDVNMGCPKDYSVKGGMGAALLSDPVKVYNILSTLVSGVSKPVTCKMRILPTVEETVELARTAEHAGVAAVAVHGRKRHERSREPVHKDVIREVAKALSIPVIANGGSLDIKTFDDIDKYRRDTGCTSVMVARAAQWNLSVFRKEGPLPPSEVIPEYIKLAVDYDNNFANSKYCIQQLHHSNTTCNEAVKLLPTRDTRDLCEIWGLTSYFETVQKKRRDAEDSQERQIFKRKIGEETDVTEMRVKYKRRDFQGLRTPKTILLDWTRKKSVPKPEYDTVTREDRQFQCTVTVDGKKYASIDWEKNKKSAEQAASLVCLRTLGIPDGCANPDAL